MASPVAFGDVVAALRLINWIQSNCIDPENNAQIRYLEFKREINSFEKRLVEYRDAFHQAISLVNDHESLLLEAVPRHKILKQEADAVIGDFLTTLTECKTLLMAHIKFDSRRGNVLDNLFWHSSTQAQVEDLRRRIQAHADKISLFVEPVRLQLATDTAAKAHLILEILLIQAGLSKTIELPKIPSSLDDRFRDALSRHSTIQIIDPSQIPLEEGVDVMRLHYRSSAAMSNGLVPDQTVEQYLHLLKAHWLVETLLKSDALMRTPPGHIFRQIIKQVQQSIAEHYKRDSSSPCTEDEFCALSTSDFDIWPPKMVVREAPLTEPIGREEMLVRLPVGSQSSNEKRELFVFRMDNGNRRIVYVRSSNGDSQRTRETEMFFDLQNDRLAPLYAISTGPRTEWSMQVFYSNGASQADYPLQTRSDAFKLQQAFIGYETAAYSEQVSCAATYKKSWPQRDGQHVSGGEIQLLQWPVPDPSPSAPKSPPPSGTTSSLRSGSSHTKASWTFRDANPSLTSVSMAESGRPVVVTALPPSPLIIAFTQDTGTYGFWAIELDHIEIEKSRPGAMHLGFRAKSDEPFSAHTITVKKSELKYWDLCTFFSALKASSKDKKYKDKDKDKERPRVKTLGYTYLALGFKDENARVEFETAVWRVRTLRQKQFMDVTCARSVAETEANTPTLTIHSEATSLQRLSVAPELPPMVRESTFSLDFVSMSPARTYL